MKYENMIIIIFDIYDVVGWVINYWLNLWDGWDLWFSGSSFFVLCFLFLIDDGFLIDRDSWKNLSGSLFFFIRCWSKKKILRLKKSNQLLLRYDTGTAERQISVVG